MMKATWQFYIFDFFFQDKERNENSDNFELFYNFGLTHSHKASVSRTWRSLYKACAT